MSRAVVNMLSLCAAACVATWAAASTPAAADTLAFVKADNVWLANPDGSGQYQVTLDGTAAAPYEHPSQADDGTIVAIRQTPGRRRQIYRMTQSGRLLNAPIDTPAPGTGAIDPAVSPNGATVAYWFATAVNAGCVFCISAESEALLSHPDRFTGASEIGTPSTGALPSWMSNDTLLLSNGSATILTYAIGAPEAETWFFDGQLYPLEAHQPTLTDGEVSRDGSRIALVRGDNQETILLLTSNGPPPAVPSPRCVLPNPTGKFLGPTWTADGGTLAWQEDDGVWTASVAGLADCANQISNFALRVPAATQPDLGAAALSPGPRPGCGNPGNPVTCTPPPCTACTPPPCTTCPPPVVGPGVVKGSLGSFTTRLAKAFGRLKIGSFLRKGRLTIGFASPGPGTLSARLTASGAARTTTIASGRRVYAAAANAKLTIRLTAAGRKRLRKARRLKATLTTSFAVQGGRPSSRTVTVRLRR